MNNQPGEPPQQILERWVYWAVSVRADTATAMRRGQLLAGFLLLLLIPLTALTINNLYYFFLAPSAEFGWYLVSDLLTFFFFLGLWAVNRKGHTRLAGVTAALLISALISFFYSPDNPSNGLVMYVLPILAGSFVIEPKASFWVYAVSFTTYTLSMYLTDRFLNYDLTGMAALLVVAAITWVTSERLEHTITANTALYKDLETSNRELQESYETTLEGWSQTLELRDRETEGHTQRVTELTLRLATVMGFTREQLVHARRGALLHDIGKMGVPDSILHKPGPLDEAEWQVMRRHPQIAYDLLRRSPHLRPALDIPHCHHERWDGSGYPAGLRGEDIPLAARIFAVVDVYDALTSDRPYRASWSKEQALAYIQQQAGRHFDPHVAAVFLKELGS
ncbi:MAG: HD-GYP domain-containing protein [Chloroflexota bacterium]